MRKFAHKGVRSRLLDPHAARSSTRWSRPRSGSTATPSPYATTVET
ncbi:hypothetical protein F4560_000048 [Saccharothrix ecbatanensis]|uniref:Uncharacterized protein n=1 Tax=Saccharothrix ecbatanensis TaxID=1105145 RepID=A0A7W9HDM4_9PSEU|nr:hypothetical protein [Saccharothrix ecbatanensis]MBB5800280.1 hypothetical protein [Saccharothrix ecbatanensis]